MNQREEDLARASGQTDQIYAALSDEDSDVTKASEVLAGAVCALWIALSDSGLPPETRAASIAGAVGHTTATLAALEARS